MLKSIILIALVFGSIHTDAVHAAKDLIQTQVSNAEVEEMNVSNFLSSIATKKDCVNSYFYSSELTDKINKLSCSIQFSAGKITHMVNNNNLVYEIVNAGANYWKLNENSSCQADADLKFKCNQHPNQSVFVYAFKVVVAGETEYYLVFDSDEQTRADSVIKVKIEATA